MFGVVASVAGVGRLEWKCAVAHDHVGSRLFEIVVGAITEVVVLLLGRRVHPRALVATKRALGIARADDVLPQRCAQRFGPVTNSPDYRVVADDGVFAL